MIQSRARPLPLNQAILPSTATEPTGLGPSAGPDHVLIAPFGSGTRQSSSSAASLRIRGTPFASTALTPYRIPGANHVTTFIVVSSSLTMSLGPPATSRTPPPHAAPPATIHPRLSLVSSVGAPPSRATFQSPRSATSPPHASEYGSDAERSPP